MIWIKKKKLLKVMTLRAQIMMPKAQMMTAGRIKMSSKTMIVLR